MVGGGDDFYLKFWVKGLRTQNGRFRYKIALRLKKVCNKVSLSEKLSATKL